MESYVAASSAVALLGFVYRENGKKEREREREERETWILMAYRCSASGLIWKLLIWSLDPPPFPPGDSC